jgi:glycosyltransferase involved in cell wall biosynthesis
MPNVTRRAAVRLAGAAFQAGRMVPAPFRAWLREVAVRVDERRAVPQPADWSHPLIGGSATRGRRGDLLTGTSVSGSALQTAEPVRRQSAPSADSARGPRCLLVTSRLDVGGLDEVVAFLARQLPLHGFQTAVLHASSKRSGAGEPPGRLALMLRTCGVEVHEADEDTGPGWIERWAPDVISAHGAPFWVFAAAERASVPFVDNLHGMFSIFGADWEWHREAARGTALAAVVTVSELLRQDYLACNPDFPPERVALIPNGVDAERRSGGDRGATRERLGLSGEYLFLSLARHSLQKNTYGLISAFGELAQRRPEAHLVVAGRPDDMRYFKKVVRLRDSLSCRDRIHLRDHVATPAALLAAADGFVLDSFFEGWSLASMEALFAGVPVVLSDVGGSREQVAGNPARGYVVSNPLGDPLAVNWESVGVARYRPQVNREEFVVAMDRLIADRERYLAAREQLAAESAQRFRADVCLERHAAVLHAAAARDELPVALAPARTPVTRYEH